MKDGITMNAPSNRPMPKLLATCVLHETPSSSGRRVFVINAYNAIPNSLDSTYSTWSYNGVGATLYGFEESASSCLDKLTSLTDEQRAALFGDTVTGDEARGSGGAVEATDESVARGDSPVDISVWEPTGTAAVSFSLEGDLQLFISCTESGEMLVAIQGGSGAEWIQINGTIGRDPDIAGPYRYAYFGIPPSPAIKFDVMDARSQVVVSVDVAALPPGCDTSP
jgi:hypothetical protein